MFSKLLRGYQRLGNTAGLPHFSTPVDVSAQHLKIGVEDRKAVNDLQPQPWNGYVPPCTLTNQDLCANYPVQTANIKVMEIYAGIEIAGDDWMRMACAEALASIDDKGGPFGALIMQIDDPSGEIIRYWANHNQVTSTNDPTAHAEVMTIRSVCASLGVFDLGCVDANQSLLRQPSKYSHCVIYSSAEPCPMCYSAICWANISTLHFAATRFDAAAPGVNFSDEALYEELSKPYSERSMKVYQCTVDNSLDAFNRWKRSEKTPY
ncbi:MAG: nucleoside deaminase [Terracidiphilus sp.]|jgi:tRNA(Arg) A34 adenosine deaminase TadA